MRGLDRATGKQVGAIEGAWRRDEDILYHHRVASGGLHADVEPGVLDAVAARGIANSFDSGSPLVCTGPHTKAQSEKATALM